MTIDLTGPKPTFESTCDHCGRVEPMGETCPACGSVEVARIGAGTQRLERALEKQVPELEVIRLDADVADVRAPLERFARADRAVLVGTQMVLARRRARDAEEEAPSDEERRHQETLAALRALAVTRP